MAERTVTAPQANPDQRARTSGNAVTGSTLAPHPPANPSPVSGPSSDSASASSRPDEADAEPRASHERLALAAYYCAERRGFAPGYALDDWLQAERVLNETTLTLARGVR